MLNRRCTPSSSPRFGHWSEASYGLTVVAARTCSKSSRSSRTVRPTRRTGSEPAATARLMVRGLTLSKRAACSTVRESWNCTASSSMVRSSRGHNRQLQSYVGRGGRPIEGECFGSSDLGGLHEADRKVAGGWFSIQARAWSTLTRVRAPTFRAGTAPEDRSPYKLALDKPISFATSFGLAQTGKPCRRPVGAGVEGLFKVSLVVQVARPIVASVTQPAIVTSHVDTPAAALMLRWTV